MGKLDTTLGRQYTQTDDGQKSCKTHIARFRNDKLAIQGNQSIRNKIM